MNNPEQVDNSAIQILTIEQLCYKYPAFKESTIRWYIHCSKPRYSTKGEIPGNGFDYCIVRVGRRVYIDENKFLYWLQNQDVYNP